MVDDGSIDLLGILGQAFQHCLGGTALSSGVGILFGEMLLNEFEERLLRIRLSRLFSFAFVSRRARQENLLM